MLSRPQDRSITEVEDAAPEGMGMPVVEPEPSTPSFDDHDIAQLRELCAERRRIWDEWQVALGPEFESRGRIADLAAAARAREAFDRKNGEIASRVSVALRMGLVP